MGLLDFLKRKKPTENGAATDSSIMSKVTGAIPGQWDDKIVSGASDMASKAGDMAGNAADKVGSMIPDPVEQKAKDMANSALNAADKVTDKIPGDWDDKAVDVVKDKLN